MSQATPPVATRIGAEYDDPSIPVLTDRIYLPELDLDIALPPPASPRVPAPAERAPPLPSLEPAQVIGDTQAPVIADEIDQQADGETDGALPAGAQPETAETASLVLGADKGDGSESAVAPDDEIEVELDRDLIAALDADFAAMLANDEQAGSEPELQAVESDAAVAQSTAVQSLAPDDEPAASAVDAPAADAPGAEDESRAAAVDLPLPAPPGAVRDDAQALAMQAEALQTAVLDAVARRLPEQIDTAVRDLMQPAIERAITRLGEEAQVALRVTLQQLVEQVLREELARRQADRD